MTVIAGVTNNKRQGGTIGVAFFVDIREACYNAVEVGDFSTFSFLKRRHSITVGTP